MVILNRKRISLMIVVTVLGVFSFLYDNQKINDDSTTQETTSTPVSSKVIVVDAGHGIPDEGDCLLTLIDNN